MPRFHNALMRYKLEFALLLGIALVSMAALLYGLFT